MSIGEDIVHRYFAAALAVAVLATACSSSSEETTTTSLPESPTTTTSVPEPPTTTTQKAAMEITSPAFDQQDAIPAKYSCDGENISPQLDISNVPDATTAMVLIMDDPDAPGGTWDHWIAYDIPPAATIAEGDHTVGTGGLNSWQMTGYGGPCPPSGTHRYFFKLFALDSELGLEEGATKAAVTAGMEGHILAEAELMGVFTRG